MATDQNSNQWKVIIILDDIGMCLLQVFILQVVLQKETTLVINMDLYLVVWQTATSLCEAMIPCYWAQRWQYPTFSAGGNKHSAFAIL